MSVLSKFIEKNINVGGVIEEVIRDLFDNKDLATMKVELTEWLKFDAVLHSDVLETREENKEAIWNGFISFDFCVVRFTLLLK